MKANRRRSLAAKLLLLAYLPALCIASLHVHQYEGAFELECTMCNHHVPHVGHLVPASPDMHDCALCLFLSLTYTAAPLALIAFIRPLMRVSHNMLCEAVCLRVTGHIKPRAPPFVPC